MGLKEEIAAEIRAFDFGDYAMPDVDAAMNDDPDAQEWVDDLAGKIARRVEAVRTL